MGYDEATAAHVIYECAQSEADASESDALLLQGSAAAPAASTGRRARLALGCAAALAVGCEAARRLGSSSGSSARLGASSKEAVPFQKPGTTCSTWRDDCRSSGCCVTTGHTCWEKDAETAFCKQDCPAEEGWTCRDLSQTLDMEADMPGTSMYCYAVIFQNKGGKLKVPEAELLAAQREKGLSIFGCQAHDVFGDVEVSLGGGLKSIKLEDEEGDFCKFTREDTGACANTAIHYQAWRKIREEQKWRDQEWVIKADADAVFIPTRLANLLTSTRQKQPSTGIYFENCKGVDSGFFGSLEVISAKGFGIFMDKLENCKWTLAWDGNPSSGWKYGAWGEDKFAQECMDKHGVGKKALFELTYDGMCEADRPKDQKKNKKFVPPCWNSTAPATHPLMSVSAWMECFDTTTKVTV